jgi:hypothetical protein
MGLLDDAIREHLELKRRRGADPGEIDRLEREALGPVRRAGDDLDAAELEAEPGTAPDYGQEPDRGWPDSPRAPAFADHGAEFADEEEDEEWNVPEPGAIEGGIGVEPDTAAPAPPVPPLPAEPASEHPALSEHDYADQETLEHDLEEAELPPGEQREGTDAATPGEADDMLEETPEFLQDTPDHDRLWFEQRPPRDFDLGG